MRLPLTNVGYNGPVNQHRTEIQVQINAISVHAVCSLLLYCAGWLAAQVNLRNAWLQLSSCMLASAFVFGNSIKTVYEDVIFLFVVHPFDVGDAVQIGSINTDQYVVRTNPTVLKSATCTDRSVY